jgi:D-alanyl-D-alanine carboxypeptidase
MKKLILTLTVLCCLGNAGILRAQQLPQALNERLQATFDSLCIKYGIKGASAAVLIPGAGIWKSAYGQSHEGVPVTTDMMMGMGSNTKIHISAALLKMQEQGLLSLDDSIGRWIRGYPNISGKITIRQCLNHTSGLADYLQNSAVNDSIFGNPDKVWDSAEILWLAKEPTFPAGTSWGYSNTNYIIGGIIIRDVLNKPFEQAIREMLLDPIGLVNTMFYGEQTTQPVAHQWSSVLTGSYMQDLNTAPVPLVRNLFSLASSAGAMITTAEDNVIFWNKLISGQIINTASLGQLLDFLLISRTNYVGYGLGVFRYRNYMNGHTIYTHGGTFYGFINDNMVDSVNGTTISVLTNQDSIDNDIILTRFVRLLHRETVRMPVTGIAEKVSANTAVRVYPNPAADKITIAVEHTNEAQLFTITDLTGREHSNGTLTGTETTADVQAIPAGLYLVCLKNGSGQVIRSGKLMIAH